MQTKKMIVAVGLLVAAGRVACLADRTPTFWEKVLRLAGISQSPVLTKGGQLEIADGEMRIVNLDNGETRPLAMDRAYYRSPIFDIDDQSVLALSGDDLFRLPISGLEPAKLVHAKLGVQRLLGFVGSAGDQLLVLKSSDEVGLLSLNPFKLEPLGYDKQSREDLEMLAYLGGWSRTYDNGLALMIDQSDESASWQVLVRKPNDTAPINVSKCRRIDCGQPSLSNDRRRVVFIAQPRK